MIGDEAVSLARKNPDAVLSVCALVRHDGLELVAEVGIYAADGVTRETVKLSSETIKKVLSEVSLPGGDGFWVESIRPLKGGG